MQIAREDLWLVVTTNCVSSKQSSTRQVTQCGFTTRWIDTWRRHRRMRLQACTHYSLARLLTRMLAWCTRLCRLICICIIMTGWRAGEEKCQVHSLSDEIQAFRVASRPVSKETLETGKKIDAESSTSNMLWFLSGLFLCWEGLILAKNNFVITRRMFSLWISSFRFQAFEFEIRSDRVELQIYWNVIRSNNIFMIAEILYILCNF